MSHSLGVGSLTDRSGRGHVLKFLQLLGELVDSFLFLLLAVKEELSLYGCHSRYELIAYIHMA